MSQGTRRSSCRPLPPRVPAGSPRPAAGAGPSGRGAHLARAAAGRGVQVRGPRLPEGSPFSAPRHHLCALSRAAPRRSCWGQLGTRPKARQRLATAGAPGRGPAPRPVSGRCSGGGGGSPRPLLPGSPGRELCACKVGTVRTFGCSGATRCGERCRRGLSGSHLEPMRERAFHAQAGSPAGPRVHTQCAHRRLWRRDSRKGRETRASPAGE